MVELKKLVWETGQNLSDLEVKLIDIIKAIEEAEGRDLIKLEKFTLTVTSANKELKPNQLGQIKYELYNDGKLTTQEDVRKWESDVSSING